MCEDFGAFSVSFRSQGYGVNKDYKPSSIFESSPDINELLYDRRLNGQKEFYQDCKDGFKRPEGYIRIPMTKFLLEVPSSFI